MYETHFIFFYMATQPRDYPATNWTYAYPQASETIPCQMSVRAGAIGVHPGSGYGTWSQTYVGGAQTTPSASWNGSWLMEAGTSRISETSEMPLFQFASDAKSAIVDFAVVNTTGTPVEYYDRDDKISYFFYIRNGYTPSGDH